MIYQFRSWVATLVVAGSGGGVEKCLQRERKGERRAASMVGGDGNGVHGRREKEGRD